MSSADIQKLAAGITFSTTSLLLTLLFFCFLPICHWSGTNFWL